MTCARSTHASAANVQKEGLSMARNLPPRSDLEERFTWDVNSVFAGEEAWESAFRQVEEELPGISRFAGTLGNGPAALLDWFDSIAGLYTLVGQVYIYASMLHAVDTAESSAKAKLDRAGALFARLGAAAAFAEPELLEIGTDVLQSWCKEEERLAQYRHYFDALGRRREHVRSAEVEELLEQASEPFRTAVATHGILVDTDLTFAPAVGSTGNEVVPAQGNIASLLSDADRVMRRAAWESYADAHLAVQNTLANVLSSGVKQHVFLARARGYASALEASLQPNHIPLDVFYNLLATYRRNVPTWHRYWKLRREALGYDDLHVFDIKAPLDTTEQSIPYEQSVKWILEGMRPLGDEYVEVLERGATVERWVDIYPNQHKTSGAYSDGWYGTHPFILMSYSDDVFGMSTLAHELGHSMHSYFTRKHQPFVYARYGMFVAEVASNFNQALVRAYMLQNANDIGFKIRLIEEAMSNFHRYFFIMPTLARFELEVHERVERGLALTADDLDALMVELFSEGYGSEVVVDVPRVGITWAQFPTHLYANFYVYQYATGIAAANTLAAGVLEGRPDSAANYLAFLRSGSSLYPMDALALAGVDMTSIEPVDRAFGVLASMVDDLEDLLEQRNRVGN